MGKYTKWTTQNLVRKLTAAGVPVMGSVGAQQRPWLIAECEKLDAAAEQRSVVREEILHTEEEQLAAAVELPEPEPEPEPAAAPEPDPPAAVSLSDLRCKHCGKDLLVSRDGSVLVPAGFTGTPNEQFIRDHAYCSGCTVSLRSQSPGWTAIKLEVHGDEEE